MAYGVQNQLGQGSAQVLPEGPSLMPLAQQLYRQKQDREEKGRQEKKDRDLDEYNRIKIVGDALDPRNFNQLVHTKVRDATAELAAKLKDKPSLADTYLMAQQQAGKLGHMSDQFNKLQQQLATTRDEYKTNKRLNTNAIAEKALGNALRDFNEKGEVDLTKNYYDEALNSNPRLALKGGTGFIPKIDPDELVEYESEGEERQGRGGGSRFKWKVKNFPSFYDVKDKGKFEAPEVTTKGVPIKIGGKQEMALSEDAYQRYIVDPADALALDIAIKDKYGDDFDVNTEQGEVLRRVEAYKNADRFKPQPKVSDRQFEDRPISVSVNAGGSGSDANINKVYERIDAKMNTDLAKGFGGTRFNALANDEQDVIKKAVETAGYEVGEGGGNVFMKKQSDGKIKVYRVSDDNKLLPTPEHEITTLSYTGTNLGKQANVKGKVQTVEKGESGKAVTPPPGTSEYKIGGKAYPKSAVEKAAKASGMSIDEYIKAANKR